jgi:putative transposase
MDFSQELEKARKVAEYVVKIKNKKTFSSKDVKHIGLKSMIANQILRKYGRNRVIKQVRNIKLVIPGQGIKLNSWSGTITIPRLNKYPFQYHFQPKFKKVNQIEIGDK